MKIRQGFVSNSSSSSFLLITTKKTLDEVLKKFKGDEKKFVDQFLSFQNMTLDGKKYVIFSQEYDSEYIGEMYDNAFGECDDYEKAFDLVEKLFCEFKGKTDSFFSNEGH